MPTVIPTEKAKTEIEIYLFIAETKISIFRCNLKPYKFLCVTYSLCFVSSVK